LCSITSSTRHQNNINDNKNSAAGCFGVGGGGGCHGFHQAMSPVINDCVVVILISRRIQSQQKLLWIMSAKSTSR
jgi:hypothetical protein